MDKYDRVQLMQILSNRDKFGDIESTSKEFKFKYDSIYTAFYKINLFNHNHEEKTKERVFFSDLKKLRYEIKKSTKKSDLSVLIDSIKQLSVSVVDFKEELKNIKKHNVDGFEIAYTQTIKSWYLFAQHCGVDTTKNKEFKELHNIRNIHQSLNISKQLDDLSKIIIAILPRLWNISSFYKQGELEKAYSELESTKIEFSKKDSPLTKYLESTVEDFYFSKTINGYYQTMTSLINDFYIVCKEKINKPLNLAEQGLEFLTNIENNKILSFINSKEDYSHGLKNSIQLNGKKVKTLRIYSDNSIMLIDNNEKMSAPIFHNEIKEAIHESFRLELTEVLHNRPKILKIFHSFINENMSDIEAAILSANNYLKYENILKQTKFDFFAVKKEHDDCTFTFSSLFEDIDDAINASVKEHNLHQYAHSISSNKYKNLYNKESYLIIKELYDLKIESSVLQNNIGKKMAAFKSPEEFNSALNKLLNSFNDFTMEIIKDKALTHSAEVISDKDNILILHIESFTQSENLGSPSWCISRHDHYFNSYTEDNAKQYFIYDFNKNSRDEDSMIGITIDNDKKVSAAHLKDDEPLHSNKKTAPFVNIINEYNTNNNKKTINSKIKSSIT